MTGLLQEKEFSRKSFVKGGGALIVGFSLAGSALAGRAEADSLYPEVPGLTGSGYLPDISQVDSWLSIGSDNTATLKTSQVEVGNGTTTGFLMVAAEELNMTLAQMSYARQDTWAIVSSGGEGGSNAISGSSGKVRAAASAAYQALLAMASTKLGVPVGSLSVAGGVVSGGGGSVTYGDLIGGSLFHVQIPGAVPGAPVTGSPAGTAATLTPGQGLSKAPASYTIVGTSPPRIDIPDKISAVYTYIQNVRVPGMLHGRVVRPRGQGGVTSTNYVPLSIDKSSVANIPDVQVVQVGNFVGVVAKEEYDAIQAAAQLKVTWQSDPLLAGSGNFWETARAQADAQPAKYTVVNGNVEAALASAAQTVSATYQYPYNAHVPIGPSCAVADVTPTGATIYGNPQTIESIPTNLAGMTYPDGSSVLGLTPQQIRAFFYEGSSTYGAAPSELHDPEQAAAVLSKAVGAPVRLQYMRWDEHGWDNYSPPVMYDVTGGIDANGNMVALDWVSYTPGGAAITPLTEEIGASTWAAAQPVGAASTSDTIYKVGNTGYPNSNKRVLAKSMPLYDGGLRNSYFRAPGAQQSHFAGEQIVDALAAAAKMDPLAFRQQNIDGTLVTGQRWLAALNAVAQAAGWQPKVAASNLQSGNIVTGRGFSFGTFASTQVATIADVQVTKATGKILVTHLYVAYNTGFTVSPGLVANQASGASIMGLSRALYEEVTFSKERVTSLDWVSYPILRFADSPEVTVVIVSPTDNVTITPGANDTITAGNVAGIAQGWTVTGAGEPGAVPPAAAIANAFFDATGVRLYQAPMTPARVRATLKAAGVA